MIRMFPLIVLLFLLSACATTVKTQPVPVSTNPSGADVCVDGGKKFVSPCNVNLACTQDHILTVSKEGFQQQDVVIKRQYQQQKVLLNAINSGVSTGSFLDNALMGIRSGVSSIDEQESSGEAYVLVPSTVSVRLVPRTGFAATTTRSEAAQAKASPTSPIAMMDAHDEQMLENTLESSASGKTVTWKNGSGTTVFAVIPEDSRTRGSYLVRSFSLAAKSSDGSQTAKEYQAFRTGRGEWQIGLPAPHQQEVQQNNATLNMDAKTIGKTLGESLGAIHWPSYDKHTDLSTSSKKSTHDNNDGSVTTHKSSTSVSAGVHVSPTSVFKLLDALENIN